MEMADHAAMKKEIIKTSTKRLENKKEKKSNRFESKDVLRKNSEDAKFIKRMREHR
jgi:hypothetical protein